MCAGIIIEIILILCLGVCQPGYFSITGLEPCSLCPDQSYQQHYEGKYCTLNSIHTG